MMDDKNAEFSGSFDLLILLALATPLLADVLLVVNLIVR
jgi:hypothetical protein